MSKELDNVVQSCTVCYNYMPTNYYVIKYPGGRLIFMSALKNEHMHLSYHCLTQTL